MALKLLRKILYILLFCSVDGAHLARMKARADAEFYTAVKLAEANKVNQMFTLFVGTLSKDYS